jgi:hypothetical protein
VWRSESLAGRGTPDAFRQALAITPAESTKWTRLGILLLPTEPEPAASAFLRAVELNRFETDAFLGLALHAEANGKTPAAEAFYLRAIESSRRFKPAYALAAFYLRNHRMPEFWRTAAAAAAIDKADVSRIVRLAQQTGANPDTFPALLQLRTEHALATYLQTAIADGRPVPLTDVAMRLKAADHQPALIAACNRLIDAGAAEPAVSLWNRLKIFEELDVAAGRSLTNGDFAFSTVQGFNWRHNALPGIQLRPGARGLRVEFSGRQAEHAVVLEQIAPVRPDRKYRFSVRSEAEELRAASGLRWQAECASRKGAVISLPKRAQLDGTTVLEMSTPKDCQLVRLALLYNREPGTVRIEGSLDLISARLELLP